MEDKKNRVIELEFELNEDGFWDNHEEASRKMQELEDLRRIVNQVSSLDEQLNYFYELIDLVEDEIDKGDIKNKVFNLERDFKNLEINVLLGEEYDKNSAIISIHAGAGGVDAQDWTEMLLRMYLRYSEKNGFKSKIIDESRGSEAGIKSVTFEVEGLYAYGLLRGEAGTHRLVRLSPFNSDNLRQTSFALVEILPVIKSIKEVVVLDDDLRIDTFRSSGAGGQSVNTTDSAVRITHLPSGVVASCQTERSQLQNKERAMKLLLAKLHKKFIEEVEKEKRLLKGDHQSAEWGSQIRSYVVHPYKMVKDHRTGFESSDPEKVLDGEIDDFIEVWLRSKRSIIKSGTDSKKVL